MVEATQTSQIEHSAFQQAALFQLEVEGQEEEEEEEEEAELLLLDITPTSPDEIANREAIEIIPVCVGVSNSDEKKAEGQEEGNNPKKPSKASQLTLAPVPVPVPVPEAEGYATYAFHRYRPQENSYREYQVSYQPSLWEPHAGQRVWGRRGNKKRLLDQRFDTQQQALDWLQKMIQRRLKKGYVLTWYSSTGSSVE